MRTPIQQDLLEFTLHIIGLLRPIVAAIARHDRDLASQVKRAANSVALNLAEAFGTRKGTHRVQLETARGSLFETSGCRPVRPKQLFALGWRGDTSRSPR